MQISCNLREYSQNAQFREKHKASISFLPQLSILCVLLFVGPLCPRLSFLSIEHQSKTSVFICLYLLIVLFCSNFPTSVPDPHDQKMCRYDCPRRGDENDHIVAMRGITSSHANLLFQKIHQQGLNASQFLTVANTGIPLIERCYCSVLRAECP